MKKVIQNIFCHSDRNLFSVMKPVRIGLTNPIIVPIVFEMPNTIPDKGGAISIAFTSYELLSKPDMPTERHMKTTTNTAESVHPMSTRNIPGGMAPNIKK